MSQVLPPVRTQGTAASIAEAFGRRSARPAAAPPAPRAAPPEPVAEADADWDVQAVLEGSGPRAPAPPPATVRLTLGQLFAQHEAAQAAESGEAEWDPAAVPAAPRRLAERAPNSGSGASLAASALSAMYGRR